jgi:PAS domain S-box-containing protein
LSPTRWWPRSIQWQMLAGLLLLESLSLALFAFLITRQQAEGITARSNRRLGFDATSLAMQAREALLQARPGWVALSVRMVGQSPAVASARITDPTGNVLFVSRGEATDAPLSPAEQAQIPLISQDSARCFNFSGEHLECAHAIMTGDDLRGYAWVEGNLAWEYEQLDSIRRDTTIFGIIWIAASCLLVLIMARSIARPLAVLHQGTQALMASPEDTRNFPLPISVHNEMGDLIEAFNRMVASLAEQRAGLKDTLSLLDSMQANAPIGLAFLDRNCRMVRVNQVFADMSGVALARHLGKTLPELLSQPAAHDLEDAVLRVFEHNEPIRNLEFGAHAGKARDWTWLVSAYPVRTTPTEVRWVGIIAIDASERKRSEEALRKSEKLAVTGRLAASIAHEINNPLEAVTNLVFLLRTFTPLDPKALHYIEMLEYEIRRISEITQQTLRFYRQSTLPTRATLSELLDSVLSLYRGRLNAFDIRVERRYDPQLTLLCFAGEIRQVIANLVGNSIDACVASGGRLLVRAWPSHDWKNPSREGLRFVVADTGTGIAPELRERLFEPFFTTKEATGTGLGLWVSHEIILKHQGAIYVRTRAAGQRPAGADGTMRTGTVFQFFIPHNPNLGQESVAAD